MPAARGALGIRSCSRATRDVLSTRVWCVQAPTHSSVNWCLCVSLGYFFYDTWDFLHVSAPPYRAVPLLRVAGVCSADVA